MSGIKSTTFNASTNLDGNELRNCCVPGIGSAAIPTLRERFFDGKPCVIFFNSLSQNNEKVLACKICTLGTMEEIATTANKYFPNLKRKYIMKITELDLGKFMFDCDLVSQELLLSELNIQFEVDGVERSLDDYKKDGGGDFIIRGYISPITAVQCKLQIGLTPISGDKVQELDASPSEVPALLLVTRNLTIKPPTDTPWGLSFLVMIVPGDPQAQVDDVDQKDMRSAVHGTLRGAVQMTFSRDRKSFDKKLEACERGDHPKIKRNLCWPEMVNTEQQSSDFEDISDGDSHSEGEGESDRGGCGMESTMDISGISGTSKSSLVKKIHNEFNITRDGEPRRSLKRRRPGKEADHGEGDDVCKTRKFDNWTNLELIWPLEERPEGNMRNREYVDSQQLDTLIKFFEVYERKRNEVSMVDSFKIDKKPPIRDFQAGKDDCFDQLHPARFQRMPLDEWSKFWPQVPVEHKHKYKNLNLKPVGADCQISDKAVNKLHNRREVLALKFFYSGNSGVARGPLVETKVRDHGKVGTISDYNWANITNLRAVQESIINYGIVSQQLWPYDQSGYMLLKLYTLYHWIPVGSDAKRIALIESHFNTIMELNAQRACREDSPADFDTMERSLKRLLESKNLPSTPSQLAQREGEGSKPGSSGGGQGGNNGGNSGGNKGFGRNKLGDSNGKRVPPMSPTGGQICYDFNNKKCTRPKIFGGCREGDKEYQHLCLFYLKNDNKYCLRAHSKKDHRI